jgi:RimJ/RimL family protein N-acetyltransferase
MDKILVREATIDDIAAIGLHMVWMHESTSYSTTHLDTHKMLINLRHFIESSDVCVFVLEVEDEIEGVFMGLVSEQWWGNDLQAVDLLLYISPVFRNNRAAPKLVNAYIDWAKTKGVKSDQIRLGITTDVNVEKTSKLYNNLGFADGGKLFKYEG